MADTERITVRLQNDRAKALEKLVEMGRFPTVSDAIRTAVDEFVDANFTPEYIERITIDLPKGNVVELECLVKDGDSVSIDDAIRNAVREYTRKRIPKAMEDQLYSMSISNYSHQSAELPFC